MTRLVAFLRGINLGATRRVGMADLRALLEENGFQGVRTLLQSGNVVLDTKLSAAKAARRMEQLIEERFGFDVAVVVRTSDELAAVVAHDPLGDVAKDPKRYIVAFLESEPAPAALEELLGRATEPEQAVAHGREIYVWSPHGVSNSRAFEAMGKLGTAATARNWSTVTKLLELVRSG